MSKRNLSSRKVASRFVLVATVGAFLLIFTVAGTQAAGFTLLGSVRSYFVGPAVVSTPKSAAALAGVIPNETLLNALPGNANNDGAKLLQQQGKITVGKSYHNDTSPPLRDMMQYPMKDSLDEASREANENPKLFSYHKDAVDSVVQSWLAPEAIPTPGLTFAGIPYPGVACNCHPPDTNGEVGATQYVQMVNEGYQVFNKTTGASLLGPSSIVSLWSGFGGNCQNAGDGDPIVMYDQIANRWIISQFAGSSIPTDQCIAVSTTSDATGSYNRYGFNLGANFFDYPHMSVWPDGYYMADNVFNSAGTARLGPQPFAFDRTAMLAGTAATFVTPGITGSGTEPYFLPADLDGSTTPASGTACPFVEWPSGGTYKTFLFHADFATPGNTTFTQRTSPPAASFTQLCAGTRSCVPESGTTSKIDGIGDRLMHRLQYRIIGGVESMVGNFSVSVNAVSGIRWFELRNVTSGTETVFQESTYQPDTDWRWLGSIAQDQSGNIALGFSASSPTIFPQVRYAGRLSTDALNSLGQ